MKEKIDKEETNKNAKPLAEQPELDKLSYVVILKCLRRDTEQSYNKTDTDLNDQLVTTLWLTC